MLCFLQQKFFLSVLICFTSILFVDLFFLYFNCSNFFSLCQGRQCDLIGKTAKLMASAIDAVLLKAFSRYSVEHWRNILLFPLLAVLPIRAAFIIFYLFLFLLTINLKLIIVQTEIKVMNKEAATKRNTLLHIIDTVHGCCTFEQSSVVLIRKRKRKKDN